MLPVYKRDWILGEDKYIELEVHSKQSGPIVIPSASWELKKNMDADPEQAGACEIDGALISVLVEPRETGVYTLEITYEIPPETRKVRVILNVH